MRTFECKKDILLYNKPLLKKGERISLESEYKLSDESKSIQITLRLEDILNDDNFIEIIEKNLSFSLREVDIDNEDQERDWRLQLDLKTTRKKLRDIENFIRNEIPKLLE